MWLIGENSQRRIFLFSRSLFQWNNSSIRFENKPSVREFPEFGFATTCVRRDFIFDFLPFKDKEAA